VSTVVRNAIQIASSAISEGEELAHPYRMKTRSESMTTRILSSNLLTIFINLALNLLLYAWFPGISKGTIVLLTVMMTVVNTWAITKLASILFSPRHG
jgi:predicted anti-sigma-YlaC factor YlaD